MRGLEPLTRRLAVYRHFAGGGARWSSLLSMPLRRRLPGHRVKLVLADGTAFAASADEHLLTVFDEVYVAERYRPAEWDGVGGTTVVDVGANVGVFSLWALRRLGASRVVAVEPSPANAADLLANVARNRADGVTVLQAAVGGYRREAVLHHRGAGAMDTLYDRDVYGSAFRDGPRVRVVSLGDVFELFGVERCDLLKLDCEGAEYEALFDAEPVLDRVRRIACEWHVGLNEHGPDELEVFLREQGFEIRRFPALDEEGGHLHAWRPAA